MPPQLPMHRRLRFWLFPVGTQREKVVKGLWRRLRHKAHLVRQRVLPSAKTFAPVAEIVEAEHVFDLNPGPGDSQAEFRLLPRPEKDQLQAVLDQIESESSPRKADIICFSIIEWSFRYQRPQQLMSQAAAQGHRVFYLSTARFLPDSARTRVETREIKPNVWEVSLAALRCPDVYGEVMKGQLRESLLRSLDELRVAFGIDDAISYVMIPSWSGLAWESRNRWNWPIVYDCMDEWEGFPGIRAPILEGERALIRDCDLLVVTAQRLFDKWKSRKQPLVLARNAADAPFFLERCGPNSLLKETQPIIGYYGAIADWFDLDLLTEVATKRPEYTFILLGGVFDIDVAKLKALPNVRLLGQQPYETMPQYLFHFDVCLIPFKINAITEATDPVKLYEYFTAGKPVVATPMPELKPYHEMLYIGRDPDEFLAQLDAAVCENNPALVARRKATALEHTWEARWRSIGQSLAASTPKASIIIVTYNNLALNRLCLESLLRNTQSSPFEIIVVDNQSTDGTPAYLRALAETEPRIRAILNEVNRGFAAANNQGLAQATGDVLVLLNNDTVVPPGWLGRLTRHLQDPRIGLVGPTTNFVGNEAKIDVPYKTLAEMETFARGQHRRQDNQIADIHMLAMFCVALRRDVFEEIGPLDEQFGIGMFEDDDYSVRLKRAGYRVVCALDSFVHHFGQAAFSKLIEDGTYNPLFYENQARYEAKWKVTWVPHVHAPLEPEPHQEILAQPNPMQRRAA